MSDNEARHAPQALPCLERGGNGLEMTDPGMSLRDYFAAKAMQGMTDTADFLSPQPAIEKIARQAYRFADAMLAARAKESA